MSYLLVLLALAVIFGLGFFQRANLATGLYWGFVAGAVCASLLHLTAMAQARRRRVERRSKLHEILEKWHARFDEYPPQD